jgi:hypothetical protein
MDKDLDWELGCVLVGMVISRATCMGLLGAWDGMVEIVLLDATFFCGTFFFLE